MAYMPEFENEIIEFEDFDDEFIYIKDDIEEQNEFINDFITISSNEDGPLYYKRYFAIIPGSEQYWITGQCKTEYYGCNLIMRTSQNKKITIKKQCYFDDIDELQKQGFVPVVVKEYINKVSYIRNRNDKISVYKRGPYNDVDKQVMPLFEYRMANPDIKNFLSAWQTAKKDNNDSDDNIETSVIHRLVNDSPYFMKSMICSYL